MAPVLAFVSPRHQEDIRARTPRTDRLLLDSANSAHGAVEAKLPACGDLVTSIDVSTQFVDDVEREREPGRRSSDLAGVDANLHGQLHVGLMDEDADEGPVRSVRVLCRADCDGARSIPPLHT